MDWKQVKAPEYVAVCGIISARRGQVYMNCQYGSFDNEGIKETLKHIKRENPGYKFAIFMDNASYHTHWSVA